MTVNRPHQRPHILIVSDDQGLAQFLSDGLVVAGFWTSVIASALQTLEVFRLRTFDAVIVDAALEGLGAEQLLLRLLGESGRSAPVTNRPVVVIAGSPEEMSEGEANRLGALAIFYPPLDIEPLALGLFAMVAAWRDAHPDALWADEAAQGQSE
jgi:DNA-binding response OmpR family regulator